MSLTNQTKPRPLAKMIENRGENLASTAAGGGKNSGQFIDPMDLQMLDCKSKIDVSYYK